MNSKFKLPFHQKIHLVLSKLDPNLFIECSAFFGGGTLLTLLNGEYRWSKDIDFLCSSKAGYKQLRSQISEQGYNAIFRDQHGIELPREIKVNQYGIRFPVIVEETTIKFEIIFEARIELEEPEFYDWLEIPCLTRIDSCSEKLLSNSDRWNDSAIESRDLIDLAILRTNGKIPDEAYEKAEAAYSTLKELNRAIVKFLAEDEYRERCFGSLQISDIDRVMSGIESLQQDQQ